MADILDDIRNAYHELAQRVTGAARTQVGEPHASVRPTAYHTRTDRRVAMENTA